MISGGVLFIFASYEFLKNKYLKSQQNLNDAIEEKENLFSRTQPKSPNWDKDKMPSAGVVNEFDSYLIAMEKTNIDKKIKELQKILDERRTLLKIKEQDLYESKDLLDKVYRLKFLESKSIPDLVRRLHFSRRQIYRFVNTVKSEIDTIDYLEKELETSLEIPSKMCSKALF